MSYQEDPFTKVRNKLMERLIVSGLNGTQWDLVMTVVRKTVGYHQEHAAISLSVFHEETGRDRAQISRELKRLRERGILERVEAPYFTRSATWRVNRDLERWKGVANSSTVVEKATASQEATHQLSDSTTPTVVQLATHSKKEEKKEEKNKRTPPYIPSSVSGIDERLWNRFRTHAERVPAMRRPSTDKPSSAFRNAVKERLEESWTEELLDEAIDNYAIAVEKQDRFFVPKNGQWPPAVLLSRKKGNSQTDELWLCDYVGETWEESARRFEIARSEQSVTTKSVPEGWDPERADDIQSRDPTYDLEVDKRSLRTMPDEEFESVLREVDQKIMKRAKERVERERREAGV